MIIRMFYQMSSGRHDGRVWPPAGVDFEVPDWEGRDLVDGGNAAWVADSPVPAAPAPVQVKQPEPVPEPEVQDEGEAGYDEAEPPRPAAPKQAWVDWAVSCGADEDEAYASTKQQLMEAYGARP